MNRFVSLLRRFRLPDEYAALAGVMLVVLAVFAVTRIGLLWRNQVLAADVPLQSLLGSFVVGLRFDAAIASDLLIIAVLWALVPYWGWQYRAVTRRAMALLLIAAVAVGALASIAEWEFYREFHERFNQLAIQYLVEDAATVSSMVWNGYPVVTLLLVWLTLSALMAWAVWWLLAAKVRVPPYTPRRYLRAVLPAGLATLLLLVGGARGGFTNNEPLQWGDAYFSQSNFANHLALNGVYMLGISALQRAYQEKMNHFWRDRLTRDDALASTRRLVLQDADTLLAPDTYPLFRRPGHGGRTLDYRTRPTNVVVILMESFSAEFVGALGADYNATPVFDRLAKRGVLFDHFFSQGTHTHQGLFATMCSFPNLPGYEYLMEDAQGQQPFRSLPAVLRDAGYGTSYVYNGSYTWDNQEGFFRNQGMQHFIGRDDYVNPRFKDPTWGVSDEDMFVRGVKEISRLAAQGPAFALLQTVSNHAPFKLPPPAPFGDLRGPDYLHARLNGIRYSDWALGHFFELAAREPWFKQTLFVILGDHGFGFEAPKARLDLAAQHIPLLIYYPGDERAGGRRVSTVGSQVDVLPTVLGLLGDDAPQQSFGRDLFRVDRGDPGWAVIKPSGDRQVVGLVRGDRLLVVTPHMPPALYRYGLNPWTAEPLPPGDAATAAPAHTLSAYVQTSLDALLDHHAGVRLDQHAAAGGATQASTPANR